MCECKRACHGANFLVLRLISADLRAVREVINTTPHMTKGIPEIDSLAGKFLSVADGRAGELKVKQEEDSSVRGRRGRPPEDTQAVLIMAAQPAGCVGKVPFQHITDEAEVENHI